jgi:threonine/homoserine/homoserine lactone efflux protein
MDLTFLAKGIVLGFSVAAPIGPMGMLCIRRTLSQGALVGFISGLGIATADMLYGFIVGLGLKGVASFLVKSHFWLHLLGGFFLCYLGIQICLSRPETKEIAAQGVSKLKAYFSTFLLTLANPATILSFTAVLAGLGLLESPGGISSAMILVLGIFLGSTSWWLFLSGGVNLLRSKFSPQAMLWVNRFSGAFIIVFGLEEVLQLLLKHL